MDDGCGGLAGRLGDRRGVVEVADRRRRAWCRICHDADSKGRACVNPRTPEGTARQRGSYSK